MQETNYDIKGTVSAISSDPPCKDGKTRFKTEPLKPSSIKNVEDTVVFLTRKCLTLKVSSSIIYVICKKCASHFSREPENENKTFKETETLISGSYSIRNSFKGQPPISFVALVCTFWKRKALIFSFSFQEVFGILDMGLSVCQGWVEFTSILIMQVSVESEICEFNCIHVYN